MVLDIDTNSENVLTHNHFLPLCFIFKLQSNVSIITLKWSTCEVFLKPRVEKSNQIVKKHLV